LAPSGQPCFCNYLWLSCLWHGDDIIHLNTTFERMSY
jgi:hypothetical protein